MNLKRSVGALLAAVLLLPGCKDSTGSRPPAAVEIFSGNGQPGTAGGALPNPLVVRVIDAGGKAVRNVTVTWAVTSGGGSVTPATSVTDNNGVATTQWTLGTSVTQAQTVTATVAGLTPATFTATPQAGALAGFRFTPDSLRLTAINETAALQAQGVDANGNPVAVANPAWTSLDPGIVTVSQSTGSWRVQAVENGRGRVQVSSGGVSAIQIVNVRQIARTVTVTPATGPNLLVGDTRQLTATARDANNVVVQNPSFTWTTSAPGVATVSNSGLVTAAGPGMAIITAATDSASATASVFVNAALRAKSLDAGGVFSCAVDPAGATYCWGANSLGSNFSTPMAQAAGLAFDSVTVGGAHQCGLTPAGAIFCWGVNERGQLGSRANDANCRIGPNHSYLCATTPVQASGSYSQVSAGEDHTCAVTPAGAAWCWGLNDFDQLGGVSAEICTSNTLIGPDPRTCASTPVPVASGLTFKQVSAGGRHSCGVTTAGAAYCWGDNRTGALGTGNNLPSQSPVPVAVAGGLTFASISAGAGYTCGVTTAGAAYCWGNDGNGQLGNGAAGSTNAPAVVAGSTTWHDVAAGWLHTCGTDTSGNAWCWGRNAEGQLGSGSAGADSHTPVAVTGGIRFALVRTSARPAGFYQNFGTPPLQSFSCGIAEGSGTVYCWGTNELHQVGDGTITDRPAPVPVPQP